MRPKNLNIAATVDMLLNHESRAVWVYMREPERNGGDWEASAFADPNRVHPSGRTGLTYVSYVYMRWSGWVRSERVRPRGRDHPSGLNVPL